MKPLTALETSDFCRSLALLLNGGISPADGLYLLSREEGGTLCSLSAQLAQTMDQGAALSDAMAESGVFAEYIAGMVRVGEQTGHLEEALQSLAEYYETRHHTARQLRQALLSPCLMLILMLTVVNILLVKILPVFDRVYATLGSRLTGAGAILLRLGQWLEQSVPMLSVLLAVAAGAVLFLARWSRFREWALSAWQRLWGDRGIRGQFHNAHFVRGFSMGMRSGLTDSQSAHLAAQLVPSSAKRWKTFSEQLDAGVSLLEAMGSAQLLSPSQCRLLSVGIRSGSGEQVLQQISVRLLEDAEDALQRSIARIEPAMVLSASVLIGLILLSVMLPLMNIMTAIG